MIIGLGGNLPGKNGETPRRLLERALEQIEAAGIGVAQVSDWYQSYAWPEPSHPLFVNAAARLESTNGVGDLLAILHRIEVRLGRRRGPQNAPRTVDLDILAAGDQIVGWDQEKSRARVVVPHRRLHERAFALRPFCDLAPDWRHPVLKKSARELLAALGDDGSVWKLGDVGAKAR